MLALKKYCSLILVLLLMSSAMHRPYACAQTTEPQVISFSTFLQMCSNQPDSIADWHILLKEPASGVEVNYRFKIARKQGKSRREMYPLESETKLENKADMNYKLVLINRPGQPSLAFDPQRKTYTETPEEFNAATFDVDGFIKSYTQESDGIKIENVGSENIDGHEATKIRMKVEGEKEDIFFYFAKDLNNLLIRVGLGKPGGSSLTVSNVSLDVPDDLFEIPEGYKREDFNTLISTLKQKAPAARPSKENDTPVSIQADPTNVPPSPPGTQPAPETRAPNPGESPVLNATGAKPVLLNNPKPRYTEEARRNGVQGIVIVRALIREDGTVKDVKLIRGLPDGLDEMAIQAVYQMRFKPVIKNGQPVTFWQVVHVEFNP